MTLQAGACAALGSLAAYVYLRLIVWEVDRYTEDTDVPLMRAQEIETQPLRALAIGFAAYRCSQDPQSLRSPSKLRFIHKVTSCPPLLGSRQRNIYGWASSNLTKSMNAWVFRISTAQHCTPCLDRHSTLHALYFCS